MPDISIVGFFCEDIREEVQGQMSLVGVFPDRLNVPAIPGQMPKISFYVRVHVRNGVDVSGLTAVAQLPGLAEVSLPPIEKRVVDEAGKDTEDLDFYGIILHGTIAPFPVQEAGIARIIVRALGKEYLAARIRLSTAQTAQTAH